MVGDNPESFADLDGHQAADTGPECGMSPESHTCSSSPHHTDNIVADDHMRQSTEKDKAQDQSQVEKENQQYHEALKQREQSIRDQQAGPAVGSPEYLNQLSGQVAAETTAGEKYILAPAAVMEAAGIVTVVATSATAETVAAGAVNAYNTAQVTVGTNQTAVQVVQGVVAAITHTPAPRTFAAQVSLNVTKIILKVAGINW